MISAGLQAFIMVCMFGMGLLGLYLGIDLMQTEAIEFGYAHYCTDTGDWAWKGECSYE